MELIRNLAITVGLALFTAGLQIALKVLSRSNLPGKNHGLTRDDALFWTDWIIAASLALGGSIVVSAIEGRPVPVVRATLGVTSLVLGGIFLPVVLKVWAYGPSAQMKVWGWKGIGWILIANGAAMLLLLGAVYAGVSIYEFK